ncbi:hypothetical protein [Actinoplanes sp. NPDC020271]|uniref:hypothetical protein n=1 Tax=Actinoplanes sp. NPDC020271 TaxID=3363896 RepID=UPI0037B75B61
MSRIALFAGSCALALSAAACSSGDTTAGPATTPAPVASSAPTESAGAPAGFAPVGPGASIQPDRQYTFGTVQSGGQKLLTVGSDGIVTLTDHLEDRALFVPAAVKAGDAHYLLRTARIVEGGEALCLVVNSPGGTAPLNLKAAACDAGKDDQIFTFPRSADGKGQLISAGDLFVLAETADGTVIVQESGEGDALTAFTVRDQGKSTLPRLGD